MSSSRTARWQGIPMLAWIALIASLTGAGVLIEGFSPRAAWAQVQVEVFGTNYFGDSVTTYSLTASGDTKPLRTISGAATGLENPAGLAVDTVNSEILVANISSITVYSLTASGNAEPLRTIKDTELDEPIGLAVDTVNNEILVANINSIRVYSRDANGNVGPLRTIGGASTGLMNPFGLAVDTVNNEVLVANFGNAASVPPLPGAITVYRRTASGDTKPLRTIRGAATGLQNPAGLAVDTANNEVLVANRRSITAYRRTANGNVAPLRTPITLTELDHPLGLGIDVVKNEVLVANLASNAITVYSRTDSGNATPRRVIKGAVTELNGPAFPVVAATTCPSEFDFDFSGNTYYCFRDLLRGNEITAGMDLGFNGHPSLNMNGTTGNTPTTWLTVYDGPAAGPTVGTQTLCADVLIVPFNNTKGAGVALLNEGVSKKGLALVIHDAGNADTLFLATVDGDPATKGKLTTLSSVLLCDRASCEKSPPRPTLGGISEKSWYRLIMTVDPAIPTVTGKVFKHSTSTDPNSRLGVQVGSTLTYSPAALPEGVTSSGKNGILGSAINAALIVSVTNFTNNATQCGP